MSSESTPVVIIDKDNTTGYYWDASEITTKVVYEYGRNRPFAYAEVSLKRTYFYSTDLYWNTAPHCPKDNSGVAIPPNIVLGTTTIHIEAYGQSYDMIIDDKEDVEDYIVLKCYNKAYKLRSAIYLSSLCAMTGTVSGSTITCYFASDPSNSIGTATVTNNRFAISYNIDSTSSVTFNCILDSKKNIIVDFIEGVGSAIFKFISVKALGFTPENCVCDKGFSYGYDAYAPTIGTSYAQADMQLIKNAPKIAGEDVVKLRVNYICWDLIKALGYLSNRWPFFYDKAYFVDYNDSNYCNKMYAMRLDYGVDDNTGENLSYTQAEEGGASKGLDIYHIVDSIDQGTSYVQSSQIVNSENHSERVFISDANKEVNGTEVVFPYPETYDSSKFDNTTRDELTRKLAFEKLATFFKPLDCVQFTISEMNGDISNVIPDVIATSFSDLPSTANNGDIGLVTDGLMKTFYQYDASATEDKWKLYVYATFSNTRDTRFSVYTCIANLDDIQNNVKMQDAPLSYVQLSWPECMTTFTFGNPEFIDSAFISGKLEQNSVVSVVDGTTDLSISDKMSAKIVVGNQTLSELDDDRTGFNGLIMEKNRNSELYRLAGYNNGTLEAYFDSQGRILSGNAEFGSGNLISGVMIDHNGITIAGSTDEKYVPYETDSSGNNTVDANTYQIQAGGINGGIVKIDKYGLRTYSTANVLQCSVGTDGAISAGEGRVKIGPNGLSTYDSNNNRVCYVGTDGQFVGIKATYANTAGSATSADNADNAGYASSAGGGYVVIDYNGLRTYSSVGHTSSTLQCSVGSKGAITAGQGRVVLDRAGLRTFDGDYNTYESSSTWVDSHLQCSVGTDGVFSAGSMKAIIDKEGIKVYGGNASSSFMSTGLQFSSKSYGTTGPVTTIESYTTDSAYTNYPSKTVSALAFKGWTQEGGNTQEMRIWVYGGIASEGDVNANVNHGGCNAIAGEFYWKTYATQGYAQPTPPMATGDSIYYWYHIIRSGYTGRAGNGKRYYYGWLEQGGFDGTSTSASTDPVSFPISFDSIQGAMCCSYRKGPGDEGNDYVSNISNSGMNCRHESGKGFYWRAWGYVFVEITPTY